MGQSPRVVAYGYWRSKGAGGGGRALRAGELKPATCPPTPDNFSKLEVYCMIGQPIGFKLEG